MALVTHQMQGSYVTLPSRPLPLIKGIKLKRSISCHVTGRLDRSLLLKRNVCLSVGASCVCRPKPKALQISAFKGICQNNESGARGNGFKTAKNSVKLKESDDPIKESTTNTNNISLSYSTEANESVTSSSTAIHRLFKKWLANLRTQSSGEVIGGILEEEVPHGEISDAEVKTEVKERNVVLKTALYQFLALDATIKIPVLIFIPFFVAINVLYGTEVSKELTPLWILGPVILGFYVKMLQWLFQLYAFTFRVTVNVIKNLPAYSKLAFVYIVQGKLKEVLHAKLIQPFVDFKNKGFKEFSTRKLKELQVWALEKYLDFVESIWPVYCRTIRFLKRANLI